MLYVRLGSCGALIDVPVGSVAIPKACVAVNRNVDFDFVHQESGDDGKPAYRISKPVYIYTILSPFFLDTSERKRVFFSYRGLCFLFILGLGGRAPQQEGKVISCQV